MRILFVTQPVSEGVGRHVACLAQELARRGHVVEVLCSIEGMDRAFREFAAGAAEQGILVHTVPLNRAPGLRDVGVMRAMRALQRRGKYDVVHAHSTKAGLLTRLLPPLGDEVVVYSPHGAFAADPTRSRLLANLAGRGERALARRCGLVLAVSAAEAAYLRRIGLPARKIFVGSVPVATAAARSRAATRADLGVPDGALCVGFVGRLAPVKDPLLAIEAVSLMRYRGQHLVVVGDGPLLGAVMKAARARSRATVHVLGRVEATCILPALDVYLQTSHSESFGLAAAEAAMAAVPIVSSAVGVAAEIVNTTGVGRIVHTRSAAAFARALDEVALEGDAARVDAMAGVPRLRERFSPEVAADLTLAAYALPVRSHAPTPTPI